MDRYPIALEFSAKVQLTLTQYQCRETCTVYNINKCT